MPLFRLHRGQLTDSLKTTIIVKNEDELRQAIFSSFEAWSQWPNLRDNPRKINIEIKPYPDNENNFDDRIGWYTQMVTTNLYEKDRMQPIGFLSEPFAEAE